MRAIAEAVDGEALQRALDLVTDAVLTVDQSWCLEAWNRAAERVLGLEEEHVGAWLPSLFEGDMDEVQPFLDGHVASLRGVRTVTRRGDRLVLDVRSAHGEERHVVVITDRTESHESQRLLAELHQQHVALERLAAIGGWQLHVPSGSLQLTEQAFEVLGIDPRTTTGTVDELVALLDEAHREPFRRSLASGAADPGPMDVEVSGGAGRKRWLRFQLSDDRTDPDVLGGTVQDVTQLRSALALAERSNAELDRFASGVAHDLRSQLATVAGFAEVLQTGHFAPEMSDQLLGRIQTVARALAAQVADLLEEARQRAAALEPVSADDAMAWVLDAVAERAAARAVTVEHGELGTVQARPGLLRQCLLNLVANAIKYGASPGRVRVSARVVDERQELVVEDDGPGVPPDVRERVFEAAARSAVHTGVDGAGLGLDAVRQAMAAMHGTVRVTDGELGGAAFVLRFRRSLTQAEEPAAG